MRSKLVSNAPSDADPIARANLKNSTTPDDTWVMPDCYAKTQRGGVLRRQGAFYATPDWDSMTTASGGVPDSGAPPSPPAIQEDMFFTLKKVRADVHKKLEAKEKMNAVTTPTKDEASDHEDAFSDTSPSSSPKRRREPDEPEKTPNPMDIPSIAHDALSSAPLLSPSSSGPYLIPDDGSNCDGPAKRRRLSEDLGESPTAPEKKRPTRRSPRREPN